MVTRGIEAELAVATAAARTKKNNNDAEGGLGSGSGNDAAQESESDAGGGHHKCEDDDEYEYDYSWACKATVAWDLTKPASAADAAAIQSWLNVPDNGTTGNNDDDGRAQPVQAGDTNDGRPKLTNSRVRRRRS